MSALRIKNIRKQYAVDPSFRLVVDHLEINKGELFALLGPSGCGKTTLLKLIAGLEKPDAGDIFVDGQSILRLPAEKRGIGMVFQQSLLFPHMTVEENVAFGLKMRGVGKKERLRKARAFLERVGLSGFHRRYPHELSGGQQQRVSLVRSLALEPKLLLLDEPFSALDPELREELRDWLKKLHEETGTTIALVTHDREEAFALADRIGVMNRGKLLQVGAPEQMYRRPATVEVARFMGLKNIIPGKIEAGCFVSDDWRTPYPDDKQTGKSGWLLIPPRAARVAAPNEPRQLTAIVKQIHFSQGAYHLRLEADEHVLETIELSARASSIRPGDAVGLNWNPEELYFIVDGEEKGGEPNA